ncbi:signal peptidase I [Coralliovum pocilloporae]|uniref:signal peptidase I n=1 Tax=Coralliovum pocilloporae TaxID=3066369 RepID=UPI003307C26A
MAEQDSSKSEGGLGETVKVIIHALLLALVVRTFLFQPFNIPSGSMKSTLLIGDYLFVSKYSYGYSRYSFPFGLVPFEGRIWGSAPERGDIAVFKLPQDNETDYIKRVIGLPGDKIQMQDGVLSINGKPVEMSPAEVFIDEDGRYGRSEEIRRFSETLPNNVTYDVLDLYSTSQGDNTGVFEVPDGHYFMMGDNRDNSTDSRFSVGFVPEENLIGRAEIIFFSVKSGTSAWQVWKWPWSVRWDRLLDTL